MKNVYYQIISLLLLVTIVLIHIDFWQFVKPPAIYIA